MAAGWPLSAASQNSFTTYVRIGHFSSDKKCDENDVDEVDADENAWFVHTSFKNERPRLPHASFTFRL